MFARRSYPELRLSDISELNVIGKTAYTVLVGSRACKLPPKGGKALSSLSGNQLGIHADNNNN